MMPHTLRSLTLVLLASLGAVACSKSAPPPESAAFLERGAQPDDTDPSASRGDAQAATAVQRGGRLTELAAVPIYFSFDSASLDQEALQEVGVVGRYLRDEQPELALTIEGHADERGSVEYNLALGDQRARATRKALERLGVDGARLRTVSFGEARPAVRGSSEAAHAKNRRAEFVVK